MRLSQTHMLIVSQLKDHEEFNQMLLQDLLRERPLGNFDRVFPAILQ